MNALLRGLWRSMDGARRREAARTSGAMILCSALELATLLTLQHLLVLATQAPARGVATATVAFLACAAAATVLRLATLRMHDRLVLGLAGDLSVRLFDAALRQHWRDHLQRETAELFAGLDKAQLLVNGVLAPLAQAIVSSGIALVMLVFVAWIAPLPTAIAGGALLVTYLLLGIGSARRLRIGSTEIAGLASARLRAAQEAQAGFREILLDQAEPAVVAHFAAIERAYRAGLVEARFFAIVPRYAVELAMLVAIGLLAWAWSQSPEGIAAHLPRAGVLALAAFRLLPLLNNAYSAWGLFTGNSAILADVLALIERPVRALPAVPATALPFERELVLQGVGLDYPGRGTVLQQLDLRIARGSRVGIMGETGSGKSSLLDIVLGLVPPTRGELLVDGVPLDSAERRARWMAGLAYVPQSIYLPDWPLAEVIAFPDPPAAIDAARLQAAIAGAQLEAFVAALPDGLATRAGDGGVRLSGGQRQRVALARALYRRASLLVLDEATGQLDVATEAGVLDALRDLAPGLTILVVAHSPRALRDCDVVYELRDGRLEARA